MSTNDRTDGAQERKREGEGGGGEGKRERERKREEGRRPERNKGEREQVAGRRAYGLHPCLLTSAKSITCLGV